MTAKEYLTLRGEMINFYKSTSLPREPLKDEYKVVYNGFDYYPMHLQLDVVQDGNVRYSAMLRDLKTNSTVLCLMDKVEPKIVKSPV